MTSNNQIRCVFIEDEDTFLNAYNALVDDINNSSSDFQLKVPDETEVIRDLDTAQKNVQSWIDSATNIPELIFLDIILPKTAKNHKQIKDDFSQDKPVSLSDDRIDINAGLAIYDAIREAECLKTIPIIILTANYRLPPSLRNNMLDDEYLLWIDKPIIPEDIVLPVVEFIQRVAKYKKEP